MIPQISPRAASSQTWWRGLVLMTCVIDSPGLNHVVSQGEAADASSDVMADTALPRRPIARPAVSDPRLLHGVAADNRLTRKEGRFHVPYVETADDQSGWLLVTPTMRRATSLLRKVGSSYSEERGGGDFAAWRSSSSE